MLPRCHPAFGGVEVNAPLNGYADLSVGRELALRRFLVTTGFRRLQESKILALMIESWSERVIGDAIDEAGHPGKQRGSKRGQTTITYAKSSSPAKAPSPPHTGQLGIIPGSMGAKSYIVRGKGNPESFSSCSDGASCVMSRTAAKKRFSVKDQERATVGKSCRKDADVIGEIPMA